MPLHIAHLKLPCQPVPLQTVHLKPDSHFVRSAALWIEFAAYPPPTEARMAAAMMIIFFIVVSYSLVSVYGSGMAPTLDRQPSILADETAEGSCRENGLMKLSASKFWFGCRRKISPPK